MESTVDNYEERMKTLYIYTYIYVLSHTHSVISDIRNNAYWIVINIYIYICVISRSITPQHIKHSSKSLVVVQSLYFGSKLPSSGTYKLSDSYDAKFQIDELS